MTFAKRFEYECVITDGQQTVWSGLLTADEVVVQAWKTLQGLDEGFFNTFVAFRGNEVVLRTDVQGEEAIRDFEIAVGLSD